MGHGTRTGEDLVEMLQKGDVETVVDVRRYPGSRRNPQFNKGVLAETLGAAGIRYRHVEALGGRLTGEPGEERFSCIRTAAFRSYAARMGTPEWQQALAAALDEPAPCFMCAETDWRRCHRRLIADLFGSPRSRGSASAARPGRAASAFRGCGGTRRPLVPLRRARRVGGLDETQSVPSEARCSPRGGVLGRPRI